MPTTGTNAYTKELAEAIAKANDALRKKFGITRSELLAPLYLSAGLQELLDEEGAVSTVRMVLSGRPALRGDSHKVAVLLGLKTGRVDVTATDLVVPGMRKAA